MSETAAATMGAPGTYAKLPDGRVFDERYPPAMRPLLDWRWQPIQASGMWYACNVGRIPVTIFCASAEHAVRVVAALNNTQPILEVKPNAQEAR